MHAKAFAICVIASVSFFPAIDASAQLTLRLEPEAEDPGTSSMPARFGHAKSNKGSGAAVQFAISYSIVKAGKSRDFIYEPYVAIAVNDNASTSTDRKSAEVGAKSVYGDATEGAAWLLDAAISRSRDRVAGTSSAEGTISAEPVAAWLKFGLGYTPGKWGLFIRPKLKLYHLNTMETDDAAFAPSGTATGLSTEVALDLFLPVIDRAKITLSGAYAHDVSVSGNKSKDSYKKGRAQVEYFFYNVADPQKGKALFSVIVDRAIGRDALSTTTAIKASTGVYVGVKL